MIGFNKEELARAAVAIAVDVYMGVATGAWDVAIGVAVIELLAGSGWKVYSSRTAGSTSAIEEEVI